MGALLLIVVVIVAVATLASFVSIAETNANNRSALLTSLKNENLQIVNAAFQANLTSSTTIPRSIPTLWNNVTLTIRNSNTANSQLNQIELTGPVAAYWFPTWKVVAGPPSSVGTYVAGKNNSLIIPARGSVSILLDLVIGSTSTKFSSLNFSRSSAVTVTLLTAVGNFFHTVYNPPTASFTESVLSTPFESTMRDEVELDAGPSTNGNGTIQGYTWTINVPPDGWYPKDSWDNKTVQTFSSSGRTFIYKPEELYPSLLAILDETGPIRVTLTVVDSNGFTGSTEATVIPGDPLAAPVASLTFVSNAERMGTCCSATLTVKVADIFGNSVRGHAVDFEFLSGNITGIVPTVATTNGTGDANAVIGYAGQGGVVLVVSEDNPDLKLQQVEGGSLAVAISPPSPAVDSGQTITLTADPSGGSGSYTVFAWYSGPTCVGTPITGATMQTYTTPALTTPTSYCVKVTDSLGGTATATVTVSIISPLTAAAITPSSPTLDNGQAVTLTSHASGGTGSLTYQWYSDGTCTTSIPFATSSTYLASPTVTTTYSYGVTDSEPRSVCSAGDTVTVNPALSAPAITATPSATDVGQSSQLSTPTSFSGGTSPYTCQWLQEAPGAGSYSNLGTSFACLSGSMPSVSTGALSTIGTWSFELKVTDNAGSFVASVPVTVNVNPTLAVPNPTPTSQTIDQGQTATLSDSAPTTGTPGYTYEWLVKVPGASTFTNAGVHACSAPTSLTCTFVTSGSNMTGTYSFELQAKDSSGTPETATSSPVTVILNGVLIAPTITVAPPSGTSDSYTISTSAGFSGGTPTYSCQWLVKGPTASGYSALTSSFACSALTSYDTPVTLPAGSGTWLFELQVTDSANPAVVVTSNALPVTAL
jgi:hypothetical protein